MARGERRGRRFTIVVGVAALFCLGTIVWLCRDRLAEAWDFHIVETGSPEESARVLARRLRLNPLRAAPYVALQILDPGRLPWVEATVAELDPLARPTTLTFLRSGALPQPVLLGVAASSPSSWMMESESFEQMSSRALALLEERQQRLSPAAPYEPFAHLDEPEAQVVKALSNGSPAIRLQALALLVRVRSPSSVAEQWKAVAELKRQLVSRAWDRALFEIEACFDPAEVSAEISRQPATSSRSSRDYACEWRLRAAGVMKLWAMLPRLRELSVSTDLNISIAAVRSLEDFTGPEADEALTYCLLGWRYYSFIRAGRALLERNPELLLKVLSSVEAPENCREWQKFFEMHGRIRLETKRSQLSG